MTHLPCDPTSPPTPHIDGCIDEALAGIHSENATAFSPADLAAIRKLVQSKPGGFAQLNSTVKRHLHRWFESQGAVRTAERISRHYDKGRMSDKGRGAWRKSGTIMPSEEVAKTAPAPFYAAGGGPGPTAGSTATNQAPPVYEDEDMADGPTQPAEYSVADPRPIVENEYSAADSHSAVVELFEEGEGGTSTTTVPTTTVPTTQVARQATKPCTKMSSQV